MKAKIVTLSVTATIEFDEHELELMKAMAEYEGTAKYFSEVTGRFSKDEWDSFFRKAREVTQNVMSDVHGNRKAVFSRSYT